jgi:hypothetical protein
MTVLVQTHQSDAVTAISPLAVTAEHDALRSEPGMVEGELPILALNSGSSSLKFGLYRVGASRAETILSGEAQSIGDKEAKFQVQDSHGKPLVSEAGPIADQRQPIVRLGWPLSDAKMPPPAAIGHRVVHGGPELRSHCLIDRAVLRQLEAAKPFAPLHIPHCRLLDLRKNIFLGCRRRRVLIRHFTLTCQKLRGCFRSPRNCDLTTYIAMAFMASPVNQSWSNSETKYPVGLSSLISATAPVSLLSKTKNQLTRVWV